MEKKIAEKLVELSRNSYDTIAADFDVTRKKEIWPEIRAYAERVEVGQKVLDAGCGNGRLLDAFNGKIIDYLGVDNSKELLILAKKNYPNQKFLQASLDNLDILEDNKFNYIFCLAVLQHLPGKELRLKVLQEFKKHLNQDGKIVMSNWNLWETKHKILLYKNILKKIIGLNKMDIGDIVFPWKNKNGEILSNRYYHAFTKRELILLFNEAGFQNIVIKKDRFNFWVEAN